MLLVDGMDLDGLYICLDNLTLSFKSWVVI
jgi:hypothetical protein